MKANWLQKQLKPVASSTRQPGAGAAKYRSSPVIGDTQCPAKQKILFSPSASNIGAMEDSGVDIGETDVSKPS